MRRIVFILMIALLPIRGWLGEAMATNMAAMNLIAPQAINTLARGQKHLINSVNLSGKQIGQLMLATRVRKVAAALGLIE